MIRSVLIGLDGSSASLSAVELGIEWARRGEMLVVGMGIIDEPTISAAAPVMIGGAPYADPIIFRERMADARRQVGQFLERFSLRCAEAGVSSKVLENVGLPCEQIALEAQRYDLIMLGATTHFHFEISEGHDDTLKKVLKGSPRPVVVVPEKWDSRRSVVVAYDGSLQSARALQAFCESGLYRSARVHVVCVHPNIKDALQTAERAIDFLRHHDVYATPHGLATNTAPADVLMEQLPRLDAALLVMGAYGKSTFREFFLGSTTRSLLQEAKVPLFLYH